jgi:hypothetical protein
MLYQLLKLCDVSLHMTDSDTFIKKAVEIRRFLFCSEALKRNVRDAPLNTSARIVFLFLRADIWRGTSAHPNATRECRPPGFGPEQPPPHCDGWLPTTKRFSQYVTQVWWHCTSGLDSNWFYPDANPLCGFWEIVTWLVQVERWRSSIAHLMTAPWREMRIL